MNARTNIAADCVVRDEDDRCNMAVYDGYIADISMHRRNLDQKPIDCHRKQLLDLCKGTTRLRILNGRKLGDTSGYFFTCHNHVGLPVAL